MKELILETIENISEIETELYDDSVKLETLNEDLELSLFEIKEEILYATDSSGKPLYSNEAKRQAALYEAESQNDEIVIIKNEIKDLKHEIATKKIKLTYLNNLRRLQEMVYQKGEEL